MNFKRYAVVFAILICILFSVSCVAAGDVNDTEMTVCENQELEEVADDAVGLCQEDVISGGGDYVVSSSQEDVISGGGDYVVSSSQGDVISGGGDYVVSSSQGDVISASNKGTFTELQNMIYGASDGDTITLEKDYAYDEGFNKGIGIVVLKDLTINGNGHTLDGLSKSRIFFVMFGIKDNLKVTLNNIVFKNGHTKLYGGAIFNLADLTVNKCVFQNNYAGTTAGAICSVGSLNCKNSNFNKNKADGDGGAIFSLSFENEVQYYNMFFNGSSTEGIIAKATELISSLMMDSSIKHLTDKISKCKFTGNVAKGRGGGAVYAFSHINIDSSTFTSNKAHEVGGAVYAAMNLKLTNSKFTSNRASVYGGAVYFKFHEMTGSYDSSGNWKTGVKYYKGSIYKCTFTKNVAKDRGGAIYGFKYSKKPKTSAIKVTKCTFKDNQGDTYNEVYGGTLKKCTYKNTVTLKTVKVKKSAKKLVLTAKLKKGSKALKNKKVTFKFNGKKIKAKTNKKGIAKVTIKKKDLKMLRVNSEIFYQVTYGKLHVKKIAKVRK
jgi:hypothetical protein